MEWLWLDAAFNSAGYAKIFPCCINAESNNNSQVICEIVVAFLAEWELDAFDLFCPTTLLPVTFKDLRTPGFTFGSSSGLYCCSCPLCGFLFAYNALFIVAASAAAGKASFAHATRQCGKQQQRQTVSCFRFRCGTPHDVWVIYVHDTVLVLARKSCIRHVAKHTWMCI